MRNLVDNLFWTLCRWLLSLRYRCRVVGLEKLQGLKGPAIVMPNHPAYVDPTIVLAHIRFGRPLRPIVYQGTYRIPFIYPLMLLIRAFEVPDMSKASRQSRQQAIAMLDSVAAALNQGESFLLYPSGRLTRTGVETVGAARSAAELLQRCPEANIVLVRSTGLWGSIFGCAKTGGLPDLAKAMLQAIGWAMASLIFFLPRRDVQLEVELLDRSKLPGLDREQLNPFLEKWYNERLGQQTAPPPIFVPYNFLFGPRQGTYLANQQKEHDSLKDVTPATVAAVDDMVEAQLGRSLESNEKAPATPLDAVGLDSLDRMKLSLEIEQRFGFRTDTVAEKMGDLYLLAAGLAAGSSNVPAEAPETWAKRKQVNEPATLLAETIAAAFVRRCMASADDVAVADPLGGVLTYRRMLVAASLMSKRFAKCKGDAVAMLLPSSSAADLVFMALHLAGKLPVLLNWTTGEAALGSALKTANVSEVITSEKLIDRLGIELPGVELIFLEGLRQTISKRQQIATLLATRLHSSGFLKNLPAQKPDDTAVILFTSGSESAPKAVPLTHRNLLNNVAAAIEAMTFTRGDSLLGFLPPFHSFGLMGNLLVPVLAGIPIVHHPDPTDARGLVAALSAYKATLALCTPTFLSYMLAVGRKEQFASLRIVCTGAEKCSEAVFDRARELAPSAVLAEGYGITECSAVISANRPDSVCPGSVGRPLAGYEVLLVHPEQMIPVAAGESGMLLVRGPSVFHGYLNYTGPSPMVEHDGKSWYRTGDLVLIDAAGNLFFRGRLKRFIKAGGEMISLPALEDPFSTRYPPTEQGPQVAVEGIELPDGRRIVLFATIEMTLREANAMLAEAGHRGVMRLDEVRRLEKVPVLGTGKTDYVTLRKLVAQEPATSAEPIGAMK